MAAQVPNIFVEQYDQGQKKIRADLMDENFAYVCTQLDNNADAGSAAQAAADAAQTAADAAQSAADAAQTTADGKATAAQAAHAAMPSGQYIDLTLPASGGTVTAPADGWLKMAGNLIDTTKNGNMYITGNILVNQPCVAGASNLSYFFYPCSAGETVTIGWSGNINPFYLRFNYANGTEPTN